ncbi:hypothetical protein LDENG_00139430 [Lucifuga dentata]|nr:hypothetical protein LDENG_00139430 [Lucifuga dentata]
MVVIDKEQKRAVVIDVAVPADSNVRKKEHEKIKKYQELKEELERTWKLKSKCPSGNWSTWGCDPLTGRVAPRDSRNNI